MGGGVDTCFQVSLPFTHKAARSVAGSPGVDKAPALGAAPQSGLFQRRLSALRQFRKEALRPTGRHPPPQNVT